MSTGIQWTDETWNPTTGCTRVSAGCENCYIETTPPFRMEGRHFRDRDGLRSHAIGAATGVRLHPERLGQPSRWRKPRRVFVNSMSDLFHEDIPDEFIAKVFAVMAMAGRHTFQVLTKRHGRMRSLLNSEGFRDQVEDRADLLNNQTGGDLPDPMPWPLPNVWLGVSVEDQRAANLRVRALLGTPAAVRFLSCEPLLGPVDLSDWLVPYPEDEDGAPYPGGIDWVIVGGESGKDARPMHPDWARKLRDRCADADVPYFFKQWGDASLWQDRQGDVWTYGDDGLMHSPDTRPFPREHVQRKWGPLKALGKARAGRELDGRTHDDYPKGNA